MLETIKKLEAELTEKIANAKHEAATSIQAARAAAADKRSKLEKELQQAEAEVLEKSEAEANAEAAKITMKAEQAVSAPDTAKADKIAKELIKSFVS